MDPAWLLWSGLFSLIGLAVFRYGRRQQRGVPTIIGILLMGYPYFVSDTPALVGIGVLLIVGLFVGRRFEDAF